MGRPLRNFTDGLYHVAARGSDRRTIFGTDEDRFAFLDQLAHILKRFELGCVAYCLMGNHYHLLVHTPDERLSRALQQLHTWYSLTFNRRRGHSAHLFRAHAFAEQIDSDDYLLSACRYIAHNPVRARLCNHPLEWEWSSSGASAGIQQPRVPLAELHLRAALGDRDDWRRQYAGLIQPAKESKPCRDSDACYRRPAVRG